MAPDHSRIQEYLDATRLVVLSTVDPEQTPASRVMGAFAANGFDVYFSTRKDTDKVRHIGANPRVAVFFQHEDQEQARFMNVVMCALQGACPHQVGDLAGKLSLQPEALGAAHEVTT